MNLQYKLYDALSKFLCPCRKNEQRGAEAQQAHLGEEVLSDRGRVDRVGPLRGRVQDAGFVKFDQNLQSRKIGALPCSLAQRKGRLHSHSATPHPPNRPSDSRSPYVYVTVLHCTVRAFLAHALQMRHKGTRARTHAPCTVGHTHKFGIHTRRCLRTRASWNARRRPRVHERRYRCGVRKRRTQMQRHRVALRARGPLRHTVCTASRSPADCWGIMTNVSNLTPEKTWCYTFLRNGNHLALKKTWCYTILRNGNNLTPEKTCCYTFLRNGNNLIPETTWCLYRHASVSCMSTMSLQAPRLLAVSNYRHIKIV